jgi:hypothetical protein
VILNEPRNVGIVFQHKYNLTHCEVPRSCHISAFISATAYLLRLQGYDFAWPGTLAARRSRA